jgi:hypothetical protein
VTTYANGSTQSVVHDAKGALVSVTTTPPARPSSGSSTKGAGQIVDATA